MKSKYYYFFGKIEYQNPFINFTSKIKKGNETIIFRILEKIIRFYWC